MSKYTKLRGPYRLRKENNNTWWLQYLGMDTLRIEASVPCAVGGSIDGEIEMFAKAMRLREKQDAEA
jgi:hypothetical protein